jgi:hypothetical protein
MQDNPGWVAPDYPQWSVSRTGDPKCWIGVKRDGTAEHVLAAYTLPELLAKISKAEGG